MGQGSSVVWRTRWLALAGVVCAVPLAGFFFARPMLAARWDCTGSGGIWNRETLVCDHDSGDKTERLLKESARCEDSPDGGMRSCSFTVERVHLDIFGVGTANASVGVDGSDEEAGYGVGVFMGLGCIRVAPGRRLKVENPLRRIEDGFVSTWTGSVYGSMTECMMAGREARAGSEHPQ